MKKDMTEKRDVIVNGNLDYTNGSVYKDIERHLNIKKNCDTRDVSKGARQAGVPTRDAQNQTSNNAYIKMTIKKIIKEKIIEMQSFDTGQLQNKLIRMEEENFNLRNRAIALEERIKFLEEKCKSNDSRKEDTCSVHGETDDSIIDDVKVEDFLCKHSDITSEVSPTEENMLVMQSTIDTKKNHMSPAISPGGSHTSSPGSSTVTRAAEDDEFNSVNVVIETNRRDNVTRESKTGQQLEFRKDEVTTLSDIESSILPRSTTVEDISVSSELSSEMLILPRENQNQNSTETSAPRKLNTTRCEQPASVQELIRPRSREISPNQRTFQVSSHETSFKSKDTSVHPNNSLSFQSKDIPVSPHDSILSKNKDNLVSPHGLKFHPVSKYSTSTIGVNVTAGSRPIPSLVPISLYSPKPYEHMNISAQREPPNLQVEMYEKQLLGQISPKSLDKERVQRRTPVDTRDTRDNRDTRDTRDTRGNSSKDVNREMEVRMRTARDVFNMNDNTSKEIPHYSAYTQSPQIPRSNSESSIYMNNIARDDLNIRYGNNIGNSIPTLVNQNTYQTNDIMVGDNPRTAREYRYQEVPNERKVEKVTNPYTNGYNPVQTVQGISEPYNKYSHANVRYSNTMPHSPNMDKNRANSRTLSNYSSSSPPNPLAKAPMKRQSHPSGYSMERPEQFSAVEYEPLSKVSPKPPTLIPGHNLNPSPNRFPTRHVNIPREPPGHAKYPASSNNSRSTVAKYNISATNFHATSRIPSSYQMTNPNYISSSTNFPSNFDNRLALPQLVAQITSDKSSIIFTWDKANNASHIFVENVDVYFLFAFHTLDLNQPPPKESSYWKRISIVNPLPLPIACTLTQSFDGQNYFFAVAAVNRAGGVGQLSNPCALKVAL